MKTYILNSGKHCRKEDGKFVTYKQGSDIVLSDKEALKLRGKITLKIGSGNVDAKIPLPEGWRDLPAVEKRQLAQKVTGNKVSKVAEAEAILEEYDA